MFNLLEFEGLDEAFPVCVQAVEHLVNLGLGDGQFHAVDAHVELVATHLLFVVNVEVLESCLEARKLFLDLLGYQQQRLAQVGGEGLLLSLNVQL